MVLLAAVYAVSGHSYVAGKLLSWTALAVAVGLCGWLAAYIYGRRAAPVAALLCASSPGLRWYVGTLQYEVVTAALFIALLVAATRVAEASTVRTGMRRALLAGVVGAALVLTRETFVLVVPLIALWVWGRLRSRLDWRHAAVSAATIVATAAMPAIAWSAVRTVEHQRLILISEKGPKEFQLGNNPLANGSYNEPLAGMAEPAGFDYIRAFPLGALTLAGRKLLYLFGVPRDGWNVPHPLATWIWRATTGAVPLTIIEPIIRGGWLLIAAIAAIVMLGREGRRKWWMLPATIAVILAVHVITLGSFRFAVPLLPALYVLASGPIATLVHAILPSLRTPVVAIAVTFLTVVAIAAQFRAWPLHVEYRAVSLDGIAARNDDDPIAASHVRIADAARGVRPVVLLAEQHLPSGTIEVATSLRRLGEDRQDTMAVRLALTDLSGQLLCAHDVPAAALRRDAFDTAIMACRLPHDDITTLAIFSLGTTDVAFDAVTLSWK